MLQTKSEVMYQVEPSSDVVELKAFATKSMGILMISCISARSEN